MMLWRDYAVQVMEGEEVVLRVSTHEGIIGFAPEFVASDSILLTKYLREHGHEYWESPAYRAYEGYGSFYELPPFSTRSVRIFKVALGEEVDLKEGEQWRGKVADWRISDRKSKDGRAIIYVYVHGLRRRYSSSMEWEGDKLVVYLKCGERVIQQRIIPLQKRLYRFRAKGDPTNTVVEMMALGTVKRPVVLVDLEFPRRTTIQKLVEAELSIFSQKLRSTAMIKAAAQNILKTIRVVTPETMSKYQALPFVGRDASLNRVLNLKRR